MIFALKGIENCAIMNENIIVTEKETYTMLEVLPTFESENIASSLSEAFENAPQKPELSWLVDLSGLLHSGRDIRSQLPALAEAINGNNLIISWLIPDRNLITVLETLGMAAFFTFSEAEDYIFMEQVSREFDEEEE